MVRFLAILALLASVAHAETPRNWYVTTDAPIASKRPVLLYFTAPWCSPCKEARRNLNQIPQTYQVRSYSPKGNPDADVVIVDVQEHPDMAETWGVDTIPAFVRVVPGVRGWSKGEVRTGVQTTQQIQAMLGHPAAQMSVRDDVCTCGCGRPGCRCQFNQGARR